MSRKLLAAIAMFLSAASTWAQSPAPVTTPTDTPAVVGGDATRNNSRSMGRPFPGRRPGIQTQLIEHKRLQEMQTTLASMHALLKEMREKAAARNSKDPVAKDNLQMWELMLAHLDQQLEQLRVATVARDDFDARRAALYNQASEKAAKEAREAQAAAAAAAGQTPSAPSTAAGPKPNPPKE